MQFLRYFPLLIALAFCASSCSDDAVVADAESQVGGKYLELRITTPRESRSNPTGGEDGDGREEGIRHENAINNLMLFIYTCEDGINGDNDTAIKDKYYVADAATALTPDPMLANTYSMKIDMSTVHVSKGDNVIAIANAGDLSSLTTLGEVRDHLVTNAWKPAASGNIADCTDFVMSNENGGKIIKAADGLTTSVGIERVAARIDFWYINDKNYDTTNDELVYDVAYNAYGTTEKDKETVAKAYIQNIAPINFMQEPTYMIKRVTEGPELNSPLIYCGEEATRAGTDIPDNYVIEPHTALKTDAPSEDLLTQWYGATRATASADFFADSKSKVGYWHANGDPQTFTASGFDHDTYMTLAYVNENTQSLSHMNNHYITGLMLRAVYEPLTVYKDYHYADNGDGTFTEEITTDPDYAKGTTFYRYVPKFDDTPIEGKCLYFSNKTAAMAYKNAHPTENGTVYEYPDAVCYYHIWLRHANDINSKPHKLCPMEFGIVRNNIYRVGIRIISAPGSVDPSVEDPYPILFRIYVNDWNFRPQETIKF